MKKLLIIISLLFVWYTSNSQEKINQLDSNGKKTGIWKKYYDNNKLRYEGQFEADKEVGVFKYYSMVSSEHPIIIKKFIEKTAISEVLFYKVNGTKESVGKMDGKNRIGKWLYYYPDGKTLMIEEIMKMGL